MTTEAPNSALAADLATAALGRPPIDVRRFGTGDHYVFGVTFAGRAPVVVRIAAEYSRQQWPELLGSPVYYDLWAFPCLR